MKRAQNVAQAVVRTRSSLPSWSCIGERRRIVGTVSSSKVGEISETSLLIETTSSSLTTELAAPESGHNKIDYNSHGGSEIDNTDEEEELTPVDRVSQAAAEDVAEGELWYELEKELHMQETQHEIEAREEIAAAVKEISEEENAVGSQEQVSSSDELESHRFYPPGRIMHIVSQSSLSSNGEIDPDEPTDERVGIYETPRELYSKIRLSKTMINDHYMPMYKKMMEMLIRHLESDVVCSCEV